MAPDELSLDELYSLPGHLIRRCQQIAVALFMEESADFQITPVQYAALLAINDSENVDATRLSQLVAFDRSTLGNVLERLEGKSLIERKPSEMDKRIKLLKITDKGKDTITNMHSAVANAQERILAPLDPDEREAFLKMLSRLVHVNNEFSRAPRSQP